ILGEAIRCLTDQRALSRPVVGRLGELVLWSLARNCFHNTVLAIFLAPRYRRLRTRIRGSATRSSIVTVVEPCGLSSLPDQVPPMVGVSVETMKDPSIVSPFE